MAQSRRVAIVVALAALYFYGTPILMGWFNTLDFPWMPYSGKSTITVHALVFIPSTIAIFTASIVAGILVLLSLA